MKDKLIRVISPFSLAMSLLLDAAVVAFLIIAVNKIIAEASLINIAFLIIMVISVFIAFFTSKEVLSAGVKFSDEQFEFTAIDDNNVFNYCDIEKIESSKDVSASFKKNFIDRYSHITVYLKDKTVITIDLGLTTRKTLNKITAEIKNRMK